MLRLESEMSGLSNFAIQTDPVLIFQNSVKSNRSSSLAWMSDMFCDFQIFRCLQPEIRAFEGKKWQKHSLLIDPLHTQKKHQVLYA